MTDRPEDVIRRVLSLRQVGPLRDLEEGLAALAELTAELDRLREALRELRERLAAAAGQAGEGRDDGEPFYSFWVIANAALSNPKPRETEIRMATREEIDLARRSVGIPETYMEAETPERCPTCGSGGGPTLLDTRAPGGWLCTDPWHETEETA